MPEDLMSGIIGSYWSATLPSPITQEQKFNSAHS